MTAKELEEKYKYFFEQDKNGDIVRGIECGSGWLNHVERFLKSLEWIATHNLHLSKSINFGLELSRWNIKIFQIKEKFGECRCYVNCHELIHDQVSAAVAKLEALCSVTCENCGKLSYDVIQSNGRWIYCLCSECLKNARINIYTEKEKIEIYESFFQKIYTLYAICLREDKVKEGLELIYKLAKLPDHSDRKDYLDLEYKLLTEIRDWK